MRSAVTLLAIALLGLFGATSIGYAAYVVSRGSVGLPVTKLKISPDQLAPARTTVDAGRPQPSTTTTATTTRTSTTVAHGRPPASGKSSDESGRSGGDD
jgi:hypothetical protein